MDTLPEVEQGSHSELVHKALRRHTTICASILPPGNQSQVRAAVEAINVLARITPGAVEDSTEVVRDVRLRRKTL